MLLEGRAYGCVGYDTCDKWPSNFLDSDSFSTMKPLLPLLVLSSVNAVIGLVTFVTPQCTRTFTRRPSCQIYSITTGSSTESSASLEQNNYPIIDDPTKEAVKLFGRLAESQIMIDPTDGQCCYGGCHDCPYLLPDGGYAMDEQFADRPTWIPHYVLRFLGDEKEHETKWGNKLFSDMRLTLTKERFVDILTTKLEYATPAAVSSTLYSDDMPLLMEALDVEITDTATAEAFFDVMAEGKEKLSRNRMGVRIRELSGGEDGMTWTHFSVALGLSE